jgi:hypothetical protein
MGFKLKRSKKYGKNMLFFGPTNVFEQGLTQNIICIPHYIFHIHNFKYPKSINPNTNEKIKRKNINGHHFGYFI